MAEYSFVTDPTPDGAVRISWSKDGSSDPLAYWIVAQSDVVEAMRLIKADQVDTQDGSTIPATVAMCEKWLAEEEAGAPEDPRQ